MSSLRSVACAVLVGALLAGGPIACGGVQAQLIVTAENLEFTPERVELTAGQVVQVVFRNRDAGVPHGLVVATRTSGIPPREIASLEVLTGPAERTFELPALAAGPYLFSCPVHPTMQVEVDVP
jgi:plastocyanin